jgi:hypothetical protein
MPLIRASSNCPSGRNTTRTGIVSRMEHETPIGFWRVPTLDDSGTEEARLIDEETLLAAAAAARKARRAAEPGGITRWSNRYATVFQEGGERLAAAKELNAAAHRVLWALLASAPYEGVEFPASPDRIAAMVGIERPAHYLATRRLIDLGVIDRPRVGWLRFNPEFVWRGSAQTREVALAEKIASAQGAVRRGW